MLQSLRHAAVHVGLVCALSCGFVVAVALPAHAALFALVDTGELYRSTDGGATWAIEATLPISDAVGLYAGATSADLYMATRSGTIYRSSNGGGTWSAVGALTASDVVSFGLSRDGKILALTETGTFYSSSNGGASFTAISALLGSDWVSMSRGPQGRTYALSRTGLVAESTNNGSSWTAKATLSVSNAVAIRSLGVNVYVLTETGEIYRSADLGTTWSAVAAMASSSMSSLVDTGGKLVAATLEGEVASSTNGTAWTWVGAINQLHVMALGDDTPTVTGVEGESSSPRFAVGVPYPNPRMGAAPATFTFSVPRADAVRLEIYDARGRLRAIRREEWVPGGGRYAIRWDPGDLPAGTYFVRAVGQAAPSAVAKWTQLR
jgi:photosystem II stability/assembly factor-like uncharacterized protein